MLLAPVRWYSRALLSSISVFEMEIIECCQHMPMHVGPPSNTAALMPHECELIPEKKKGHKIRRLFFFRVRISSVDLHVIVHSNHALAPLIYSL